MTRRGPNGQALAFADRGPIARSYRRFLGRASIMMFALIIVSAYLLPLLYMVTTSLQQPGQSTTPGAPVWPARPQTGEYQGETTRSTRSRSRRHDAQLMLVEKGRESSVFVDPTDPTQTRIEWQGRWRTLEQAWTFAPDSSTTSRRPGTSSTSRGCCFNTCGDRRC